MKYEKSAGVIVYTMQQGQPHYLLLHHAPPSSHWDFPKGHLEAGETEDEAALRELKEETGLSTQLYEQFAYSFNYFFKKQEQLIFKTVTMFVGPADHQKVHISWEHQGFAWLPFKKAIEQLTYENAQQALTAAHEFLTKKKAVS